MTETVQAVLAKLPGTQGAGYPAVPAELADAEEIPLEYKRWREPGYAARNAPDGWVVVRVDSRGRNMGQMIFE